jgi:hypothetical protein
MLRRNKLIAMGWLMLLVGLLLPPLVGWWLIGRRRADVPLSLLGLASLPLLVWAGAIAANVGPCDVGACVSSSQHSRLVLALVALAIVAVAFGLLGTGRLLAGGAALAVAEVVGAIAIKPIDTTSFVALLLIAAAALGYLVVAYTGRREVAKVPDYPPA